MEVETSKAGIAKCRLARALAVAFVLMTAALSLLWSHSKLLSQDEMYAFQTDSLPTVAQLMQVQRTWPISLDPPLVHLLSHAGMKAAEHFPQWDRVSRREENAGILRCAQNDKPQEKLAQKDNSFSFYGNSKSVLGVGAFALRIPALLGFLLMQVCLFFFVRRLAGERAAAVAVAFPALTATLYYSVEGRPYGVMLGLYALALLCWQACAQREARRGWALVGLALAIAATINAHYFGILLLVPICAAEKWRTLARWKIDWPVCAAIVAGMASFAATLPYLKTAGEFRKNYYNAGGVGLHDITRAYRSIFVDYTRMPMPAQHLWIAALLIFAAALAWGCWRSGRRLPIGGAEWALLLSLAALPFCGYLLARFVTHAIEVRYVLGAVVAISAMIAIALSPWLRRDGVFVAVMVALGVGVLATGAARIHAEQRKSAARLASLVLPAEARAALLANADGRLYVQDMGAFEEDRIYEPDAEVRARMTLVYSRAQELRWNRHDTMALTAMHMQHFAGVPVISYEELRARPGKHVFVLYHTGWDWTDQAFAADGARVTPLGHALGGDLAVVSF